MSKMPDEKTIYVIESGSNENGTVVKYSNGDMECRHKIIGNQFSCTEKAWNGFYYADANQSNENTKTWNFPAEFIDSPIVNVAVQSNAYTISSLGHITNQYAIVYCVLPYSVDTTQFTWHLTAKGRWK